MDWLNSLEPVLKAYWMMAGVATLIFAIQTVLTFAGLDGGGDGADTDFSGDASTEGAFPFFSLRNLVNFFLGFGWGGVCFYNSFSSHALIVLCALLTGIAFVLLFFFLIKMFLKLGRDNTFKITETLQRTADVYLSIPAEKSGKGKIQISVRGSVHEIDAMTAGEKISTGAIARVVDIIDSQTVLVSKI
ncbi:MAG: serine protease [Bacteroidales bacterium]|nr:serine protease [Bacteroidales bacterium]